MKRVLCPRIPAPGRDVDVPENEAHHLVQVLRARDGESVQALDGRGGAVLASLRIQGKSVRLSHLKDLSERALGTPQVLPIQLELAVLKGDAMEWAIEKAVELGVRKLVPLTTAHTVVQTAKKGPQAFQERWQKIADQALKQCGRWEAMQVEPPLRLDELLSRPPPALRLWCHDAGRDSAPFIGSLDLGTAAAGISLLVGPEGGWSDPEIRLLETSTSPVSLGPLVLRAETAALFAVSSVVSRLRSGALLDKSSPEKGN